MQINLEIEFKDFIVHCTMYCTSCELEKKMLKMALNAFWRRAENT